MQYFSSKRQIELLLLFVILIGLILRFWRFTDIPFTYDELSALYRLRFDSFSELVKEGITPDAHPAGVQMFLFFWVRVFGSQEIVVKLPFMLAGILSVWLSYLIAKLWFNSTTAILTATYIASLQMFVLYSQIARPYASGLFLTLLMVFFWSKYIRRGYKFIDLVLFVLFAVLASYNHHFSLLFAVIVGISGLWFVEQKNRMSYIAAGIAIFILYIPHLPIFFQQLQKGGIGGWLAKPSPWFPFQFFEWLMHYSIWVVVALILVFLFLFYTARKAPVSTVTQKIRLFMLFWFLLPLIIGYAYSVMFEPIIQYSLLIFSTPYLFMILFSYLGRAKPQHLVLATALVLLVNLLTLIFKREHYKLFYKQPFEHVVKSALALNDKYPGDVIMVNNYIPYYTDYYFRKFHKEVPYFTVRNKEWTIVQFDSVIGNVNQHRIITSGLDIDYFQIVRKYFPYLIDYDRGFTFEEYTFSRDDNDSLNSIKPLKVAFTDFKTTKGQWRIKTERVFNDTIEHLTYYHKLPDEKFGPSCTFPISDVTDSKYVFVDVLARIKPLTDSCSAVLVVQINKDDEMIFWKGINFTEFELVRGKWQDVYVTMNLQDIFKSKMNFKSSDFEVFIWNPRKENFLISDIQVWLRPGNPYRYSLFSEI